MDTLTAGGLRPETLTSDKRGAEAGDWGLLLIPVLLCLSMMLFALATQPSYAPAGVIVTAPASSPNYPHHLTADG